MHKTFPWGVFPYHPIHEMRGSASGSHLDGQSPRIPKTSSRRLEASPEQPSVIVQARSRDRLDANRPICGPPFRRRFCLFCVNANNTTLLHRTARGVSRIVSSFPRLFPWLELCTISILMVEMRMVAHAGTTLKGAAFGGDGLPVEAPSYPPACRLDADRKCTRWLLNTSRPGRCRRWRAERGGAPENVGAGLEKTGQYANVMQPAVPVSGGPQQCMDRLQFSPGSYCCSPAVSPQ